MRQITFTTDNKNLARDVAALDPGFLEQLMDQIFDGETRLRSVAARTRTLPAARTSSRGRCTTVANEADLYEVGSKIPRKGTRMRNDFDDLCAVAGNEPRGQIMYGEISEVCRRNSPYNSTTNAAAMLKNKYFVLATK